MFSLNVVFGQSIEVKEQDLMGLLDTTTIEETEKRRRKDREKTENRQRTDREQTENRQRKDREKTEKRQRNAIEKTEKKRLKRHLRGT